MESISRRAPSWFVDDGPFERRIDGVPGLYPEMILAVQICTKTERMKWAKEYARRDMLGDADGLRRYEAEFIAQHIKSWSIPRPVMWENVAALSPRLYDRIFALVLGDEPGDLLQTSATAAADGAIITGQLQESA